MQHKYTQWNNTRQTEITADCRLFDERFQHRGYFVFTYGSVKTYDAKSMTKLDVKWTKKYPQLLPNDRDKTDPATLVDNTRASEQLSPQVVIPGPKSTALKPLKDPAVTIPPVHPPTVVHTRPPDSGTHLDTRRNAKKPSRFLNVLLQEELVESDSSSDSY